MNYCALKKYDIANGEGVRVSLFVSGCRNRCKGCFQPETWDFNYGTPFTEKVWDEIFSSLDNPSVRGLTLLGGEPMEPENQIALLPFLLELKRRYPSKTVWIYTGYLYEQLLGKNGTHHTALDITPRLLSLADILVDGRFDEEKARLGLRFRGSENQRIIDLNRSEKEGSAVIWEGVSEDKKYEIK